MTAQQSEPQQQQQQQQPLAPQPVVIVMTQPMINGRRPFTIDMYNRQCYSNRGAVFSNGWRFKSAHMLMFINVGIALTVIGLILVFLRIYPGAIPLILGGVSLGVGIYLWCTAKKQFQSLPLNHPDRIKYAPCLGPSMYIGQPMQSQMMAFPTATAGQPGFILPGIQGGQPQPQIVSVPVPSAPISATNYVPENDPPPAYSDVLRDT